MTVHSHFLGFDWIVVAVVVAAGDERWEVVVAAVGVGHPFDLRDAGVDLHRRQRCAEVAGASWRGVGRVGGSHLDSSTCPLLVDHLCSYCRQRIGRGDRVLSIWKRMVSHYWVVMVRS